MLGVSRTCHVLVFRFVLQKPLCEGMAIFLGRLDSGALLRSRRFFLNEYRLFF